MIFAYKDVTIFMILVFIGGIILSVFLPFKFYMKIIFIIVLLIALIIFSLFSFRSRIIKVNKKYEEENIDVFFSEIDILITKCMSKYGKDTLLEHKVIKYILYNKLTEASEIVKYFENTNSKVLNDEYYFYILFLLNLKQKNMEEAKKILDNIKIKMRNDKWACTKLNMEIYDSMNNYLKMYDSNSMDQLLELEKNYLNKFNKDKFEIKNIDIASKLIVIYKKLGNNKEEQKYRDYIKEYVGEYYTFID